MVEIGKEYKRVILVYLKLDLELEPNFEILNFKKIENRRFSLFDFIIR